jgi:hypothetical protein
MNPKQKKQSSADSAPAAKTTIDSASPHGWDFARPHEPWECKYSVGDLIVEVEGSGTPRFGIILSLHRDKTLAVRFADGVDYAFHSHCQLYSEWLASHRD